MNSRQNIILELTRGGKISQSAIGIRRAPLAFRSASLVMAMSDSMIRQGFSQQLNEAFNHAINREFAASYNYLYLAQHFCRSDVAMHGFAEHFFQQSLEETQHGRKLLDYVLKRGGSIELFDIPRPEPIEGLDPLKAFNKSLEWEKTINEGLKVVHAVAANDSDGSASDFLEGEFLQHQVSEIREVGDLVSRLDNVGPGLGYYLIDQQLLAKVKGTQGNPEYSLSDSD